MAHRTTDGTPQRSVRPSTPRSGDGSIGSDMTRFTHAPRTGFTGGGLAVGAAIGLLFGLLLSGDLALMLIVGAAAGLLLALAWELHRSR